MVIKTFLVAALTAVAVAKPIPDPLHVIRQSGPAAGQTFPSDPKIAGGAQIAAGRKLTKEQVITKCSAPSQLALAYDDGPYQHTQKLVDTLTAGGAKGTFFVTGTLYGCIYEQKAALQNAYKAGHQIASHSWSHPQNFGSLSAADLTSEMARLEQALINIIGAKPTYMRPPYLATSSSVLSTMQNLGYRVITNDIDTGDWNGQTPQQSQQKFTQAGAGGDGHIPLMHETYASTVDTLTPWLINWAKNNNLKLVTVAECLGDTTAAYKNGTANSQSSC